MKPVIASVVGALCASQIVSAAVLVERACAASNIIRLFRSDKNLPDALVFCSAYLSVPAITVTSTVSPVATVYQTSTSTSLTTLTEVSTFTTTTQPPVFTQDFNAAAKAKRVVSTPAFLSGQTYGPSQISSACGCLTIAQTVTTAYTTLPTSTYSPTTVVEADVTVTAVATETTTVVVPTTISAPYAIHVTDYETGEDLGYMTSNWATWPGDSQYAQTYSYNPVEKSLQYYDGPYFVSYRLDGDEFLQTAYWWFQLTNNAPVQFDISPTGDLGYGGSDQFVCQGAITQMGIYPPDTTFDWSPAPPQRVCRLTFADLP